jgi:hypothetical protein
VAELDPLYSKRTIELGGRKIVVVHEVGSAIPKKLAPDERKARREDNKKMKSIRQKVRKRRKHGR